MTTTQTDAIKLALETGLDCAREVAAQVHEQYKGYKPNRHAAVDADVAQIEAALAALHELARAGEAVANSAILARGRFHFFKGEDGEPDDWEWFEEGTNCEHGCIDAVIVRADAIAAPQPAQPSEPAQP
jgi:hypothetical protein